MEGAEAQYTGSGRLDTLPNSLFIEETTSDEGSMDGDLEQYEDSLEGISSALLEPGDLFYCRSSVAKGRDQFGIFLGLVGTQPQIFLADGRWVADTNMITWSSPVLRGFATEQDLIPIRKHLPVKTLEMRTDDIDLPITRSFASDVPHVDGAVLMQRMATISAATLDFRRNNLQLMDSVYERIADDERYKSVLLDDIYSEVLDLKPGEVPFEAQMAIYLELRKNSTVIQPVALNPTIPSYVFLPKKLAKRFEQVCGWARQYQEAAADAALGKNVSLVLGQNPLTKFIEKARRSILKSRALRSPTTTGCLGPSSVQSFVDKKVETKDTGIVFSEDEKMILELLWDCYIRVPPTVYRNKHHSIGSLILRAIGAYPKLRLEREIGGLLLQELGVSSPWADVVDRHTALPIRGRRGADKIDFLFAESEKVCDEIGLTENPDRGLLQDSMAHLREDLGDLPVFVVDSVSTKFRDDAYSLEPNPDMPGSYWIHVHVAHPSAFFSPDHIFGKRARAVNETWYHQTFTQHMLPTPFAAAMSLDGNSPTMTTSTLITESGEVLDVQVRPTRIHNIIPLDPLAVHCALGRPILEQAYLILGQPSNTDMTPVELPSEDVLAQARMHLPTLQKLEKLLEARSKARRNALPEYADFPTVRNALKASVYNVEDYDPDRLSKSYHYMGDPTIKVVDDRHVSILRLSELDRYHALTTMVMTLACESAGKWFADRNIPACFSGSTTQPGSPLSVLNNSDASDTGRGLPLLKTSAAPLPHVWLDTNTYMQFTSPIRRFRDLLAQWQANSYLRAVADGLIKPGDDAGKIQLSLSRQMVEQFILEEENFRRVRPMIKGDHHWAFRALFRAFHFKEAQLPETWDVMIVRRVQPGQRHEDDTGVRGWLRPFNLSVRLLKSPEGWEKSARPSSYMPVKLELVDLALGVVFCRPVGGPSDTPHHNGPFQIVPKAVSS
ncbi:3'-5' RNA exonuclease complex component [Exophiala xenobiotica]|uniref:3'-5' RNA exonuclease complex component n=1 Tax=Vermiconidia calcicola TaxID=1690605 RepID=A0AAV9PUS7_9PEZI|nr:3'-5' RNA exonuclease complex component [Exophiala xenobiotica]KAK5529511.1 3'-5' RNA exonuclease complex component [Vermiconidia calcicola]KAK5532631.1 3'-5' RNA exonuclease complex component [Chaetothyriales sp. CCFEE 6169]KAK5269241.1 3'-5' RNA exonuclease complex component [Exophiala xenobiotica]KAK5293154.1 3'-5' RNA exonuclease complex component [Exophiala xenobiotica]